MFVDFGLCPRSRCRCAVIYIKLVRSALMLLSLLLRLPFSPSSSNVPRDLRHLFTLSWPQIGAKWYSNKEGILRRIKTCYKPKKHRFWLQQTSLVESSIDHLRPLRDFGGISSLTTHLFLITQRQLRVPNKIRTEKRKQLFWATSSLWRVTRPFSVRRGEWLLSRSLLLFFLIALKKFLSLTLFTALDLSPPPPPPTMRWEQ